MNQSQLEKIADLLIEELHNSKHYKRTGNSFSHMCALPICKTYYLLKNHNADVDIHAVVRSEAGE